MTTAQDEVRPSGIERGLVNSEQARAWEYYKHEDSVLAVRTSYGMIVQSMLLLSYSALLANPAERLRVLLCSVEVVWYSAVGVAMIDTIDKRKSKLREYVARDPIFATYWSQGRDDRVSTRRTVVAIMGLAWGLLLVAAIVSMHLDLQQ